jgi:hypothetical protein
MRRLGLGAAVALLAWPVGGQQRREVIGDYIEGRSNHVYGCYCEWSGEGQTGGREAILAWAVRQGSFDGVSLAGVKMAAVIVAEKTLSMGQAPRTSILFFDSAASAAQRQAAERLLRQRYALLLGEVRNVHAVPIQFRRDAESAALGVGEMLNLTMRRAVLPDDVLQGATLWYDPFIPLEQSTLGTTLQNRYWGGDFDQRWAHSEPTTSGYFGRFRLALE